MEFESLDEMVLWSSGANFTYNGRFELLSLSGSFMSMENGRTRIRFGGMSVSLARPYGRFVRGGVAGQLVVVGPVQVVVGSFLLPSFFAGRSSWRREIATRRKMINADSYPERKDESCVRIYGSANANDVWYQKLVPTAPLNGAGYESASTESESLVAAVKEKDGFVSELRDAEVACGVLDSGMENVLEMHIAAEEEEAALLEQFANNASNQAALILKDAEEIANKRNGRMIIFNGAVRD